MIYSSTSYNIISFSPLLFLMFSVTSELFPSLISLNLQYDWLHENAFSNQNNFMNILSGLSLIDNLKSTVSISIIYLSIM